MVFTQTSTPTLLQRRNQQQVIRRVYTSTDQNAKCFTACNHRWTRLPLAVKVAVWAALLIFAEWANELQAFFVFAGLVLVYAPPQDTTINVDPLHLVALSCVTNMLRESPFTDAVD